MHAEELGFAGLWVSDHVAIPASQSYPSPHLYDPLVTLTWAAAATERIGLGTSVLVAPSTTRSSSPTLASLDALSGGRVTVGVGVGWSEAEFAALDQDQPAVAVPTRSSTYCARAGATIPSPSTASSTTSTRCACCPSRTTSRSGWSGSSEAGYRRATTRGDGFHAIGLTAAQTVPVVERIRRDRPEPEFTISMRTGWDPLGMDHDTIR